jgi:hypothetical protein
MIARHCPPSSDSSCPDAGLGSNKHERFLGSWGYGQLSLLAFDVVRSEPPRMGSIRLTSNSRRGRPTRSERSMPYES